ncbi:MAG: hypothetical protein H8E14_13115, partial [Candidatus Marinimicrobia bacterium]|nr:hypothetical protein [Candidatus Neomarinimicrobiota bacterium]
MIENKKPTVLGLKRSFGFGDRLGLATPGHMDAIAGTPYLGIFAQQSIRELNRTNRQPIDVLNAVAKAVENAGWTQPWGADADHLQTQDDVIRMTEAGYTFFTIDPSAYVNNNANNVPEETLFENYQQLITDNKLTDSDLVSRYMATTFELADGSQITFD